MARPVVAVRRATVADAADVLAMWREVRELGSRSDRSAPPPSEDGLLGRLEDLADDPHVRVLVATLGEEVVGLAVLTHQPIAGFFDCRCVQVQVLHVRSGHRRRGVGRALLASAATYAEEIGVDQLVTNVYPHLRDTNRFYARLGFGPLIVRRGVTVATLRRRLAAERGGGIDEVLARRRTVRGSSRVREALASARSPLGNGRSSLAAARTPLVTARTPLAQPPLQPGAPRAGG